MCDGTGTFGSSTSGTTSEKIITASSLLSAFGSVQQGNQGKAFYDYRANQAVADAAAERGAGEVRAGKIRKAGAIVQGQVRAGYAGSGIDVNSGTALVTSEVLARNISEDATAELLTGERRGRALEAQAAGDRAAGANAKFSGYLGATRSLLSGTAAVMDARTNRDKWLRRGQLDAQATKRAEFKSGGGFEDGEF